LARIIPFAHESRQLIALDQIQAFLVLCEELHFGRAAARLNRSQPRVSRLISSLETDIGGILFERTNRRVSITALGSALEARWRPAHAELLAAYGAARRSVQSAADSLTIGFTATTEVPALTRLLDTFALSYPAFRVAAVEVDLMDPFASLRSGTIDVLYDWLVAKDPDLEFSEPLDHQHRLLAVATHDPFAQQSSVAAEQLAERSFPTVLDTFPAAMLDALFPPFTPGGKPIPRTHLARSIAESWQLAARGLCVHLTVTSMAHKLVRDDIALVTVDDLPPLPLGLIWCRDRDDAAIRAIVEIAGEMSGAPR
jgi:DNA-binding transcriptional LysR family regulator